MEELEERFGANLRLLDREQHGGLLGFVGVFSRLWKGSSEVSIKEVAEKRFLVCFANQLGMARVLDMEPLTFCDALVLLIEIHDMMCGRLNSLQESFGYNCTGSLL
ncbi:unnamed protein product [Prunus armeniaca]|uniref:Uncharacterized protein n=1 Tax=Prunus armeniaca TaxID=36596 RepID=A0A6J5VEL0_PRUAR|nr:unnamed protein product [Prunus armeniaca]